MSRIIWTAYKAGWEVRRKNGKLFFTYKKFHQGVWIKGKTIVLPPEISKRVELIRNGKNI